MEAQHTGSYRNISLWFDTLPAETPPRAPLQGTKTVDIAIIGAGYTGLWTAYYLKQLDPSLSIAIVEAEVAGFGASGRNGGWLKGGMAGDDAFVASLPPGQRHAAYELLHGIVDHVAQVTAQEQIDCDLHKGGVIFAAARYTQQLTLLRATMDRLRRAGHTDDDYRWLDPRELASHMQVRNPLGAIYSPHCGVINPARLVRGLADTVERQGVMVFERSPVRALDGRRVITAGGELTAGMIVPAVEGYLGNLPGLSGYHLPVQSLIVATEPLSASQWDEIGLADRPAFSDAGRFITYGQRSADERMVFGARGAYRFGAQPRSHFDPHGAEFDLRKSLMTDLFPSLQGARVTHAWGGTMAMSRRFAPHVVHDARRGLAIAGGYGGGGVGASNLFGRTLADVILEKDTLLTRMPWVHRTGLKALRRWEPEPIPWLVYQSIQTAYGWEEAACRSDTVPVWRKQLATRLAGSLATLIS